MHDWKSHENASDNSCVCQSGLTQTEIIAFVFMSDSKWAQNWFKKFL